MGQEAEGRGDVRVPRLQERGVRHDAGQGGRQEEDRQDVLPRHGAAEKVKWTIFYLNLMFQLKHRAFENLQDNIVCWQNVTEMSLGVYFLI